MRFRTSVLALVVDGTVTILARATQSLSRFDLDVAGQPNVEHFVYPSNDHPRGKATLAPARAPRR